MAMTRCIACEREIEAGSKFCTKCGSPQACECGNTNIKGGSYCSRCGKYMADKRPQKTSLLCKRCLREYRGNVVDGKCPYCGNRLSLWTRPW